jgi:hypothetical protein
VILKKYIFFLKNEFLENGFSKMGVGGVRIEFQKMHLRFKRLDLKKRRQMGSLDEILYHPP